MTLEELIADAKVNDEMELVFGDSKFKLGDLRAHQKTSEQRLQGELAKITAKQNELNQLATQAAELIEKYKNPPAPAAPAAGDIDFDTDPLFSPFVQKKMKPLEAKLTEFDTAIKAVQQSIADSAKFLLHDYYDRRWNSIPETKRPKDKGWKDYLRVAGEKRILNEFGLPDPVEAFNREVVPQEIQAREQENAQLKQKVTELEKQLSMPRMPRPGASGAPKEKAKEEKPFGSADELVDTAFADPTIQSIIGGNA